MASVEKPTRASATWYRLGLLILWLVSLALRFWGLGRFNTLVFDEVYYVKFAHNYLSQTPFFDGHPPLSKYLIALGIWIGNQLPFGRDGVNGLAGGIYTPWSYRWLNAVTGSFIPLAIAGIAYQLTHRYRYGLIAGLFAALDGLLLVESRYALNNVYLLLFGLLGLWCLLLALNNWQPGRRELWLVLSGIAFGGSASIKWNGLWFLFGALGLWVGVWGVRWLQILRAKLFGTTAAKTNLEWETPGCLSPVARLTRLKWWQVGLYLGVIPVVFYRLSWIPHLNMNPKDSFWGLQTQILTYHQQVGDGPKVHPYCSDWYTWLVMWRPVAYFYQVTEKGDPLPNGTSSLAISPTSVIYDVHAIGNPALWWLSTIAILLVIGVLGLYVIQWLVQGQPGEQVSGRSQAQTLALSSTERWLLLFLLVNYSTNLLPWVPVNRCVFLYHYMGASIFATMALAWLVDRWLSSSQSRLRTMGIAIVAILILAFIFWMPIYLGLPLSPQQFQLRMWFPSWL